MAPSKRSAVARAGPPVAPPASGWPATKRGILDGAASARFVEPTSVTVVSGAAAASTSRTVAATSAPTGTATTTSSAPETASRSEGEATSTALAPRLAERRADRCPSRVTRRDAGAPCRERDGRADEPGADDCEAGDDRRRGRCRRRRCPAATRRALLLHHVEHGREERSGQPCSAERAAVGRHSSSSSSASRRGVDHRRAGLLLVRAHAPRRARAGGSAPPALHGRRAMRSRSSWRVGFSSLTALLSTTGRRSTAATWSRVESLRAGARGEPSARGADSPPAATRPTARRRGRLP